MSVGTIELLLLIAAIVAMVARRFHVPYSVGLVLAGIALSFAPALPQVQFSRELIFTVFLPPLIFEAALFIRWAELRKNISVVLALASVGVIVSAIVTALGLRYIAHWEWSSAILFGILIAATDPVSVIATFKEAGVQGRLRLLIEAESLCNDGSAAALFTIAAVFISGANLSWAAMGEVVLLQFGGGIVAGALVAGIILLLAGRTTDHLVEITLTTVAAYGSFLLAEHFHSSGVLSTLVAGLILGNLGPLGAISPRGKEAVESFWEYAAFVANSFMFLLIGMNESREHFGRIWSTALLAIGLVLAGRAAAVYVTLLPVRYTSSKVSAQHQHVLFWGGLRGALALALALGLPATLPRRDEIITISFAVVAFSVFVQGLTLPSLLRRVGELPAAREGN